MMETPQQVKRKQVSKLFGKFLKKDKFSFHPTSIRIHESTEMEKTACSFEYQSGFQGTTRCIKFEDVKGDGFVDCVFSRMKEKYQNEFSSLENIRLLNLNVRPNFNYKKDSLGSGASVQVCLKLKIKSGDYAEFSHTSNSLVNSGFAAVLSAFEFYINCEKCFYVLRDILQDAEGRNRFDTVESCLVGLSSITEFNRYAKKK